MASNSRRRDSETGDWANDKTLYLTVSCWRKLAMGWRHRWRRGARSSSPATCTSEYVGADGQMRTSLEMTATSVGLDLARCIAPGQSAFRLRLRPPSRPRRWRLNRRRRSGGGGGDGVVPAVIITDVDDEISGIAPRDDELSPTF